jgi:hypothetical protein
LYPDFSIFVNKKSETFLCFVVIGTWAQGMGLVFIGKKNTHETPLQTLKAASSSFANVDGIAFRSSPTGKSLPRVAHS